MQNEINSLSWYLCPLLSHAISLACWTKSYHELYRFWCNRLEFVTQSNSFL